MGAFDFLVKKEAREPKKEPVSKKTVPQSITGEVHLPQEFEPSNLRPIGTDYNKYLEDAIRKHNQQGPDYLEFSDALARLNSQALTEVQKYQVTFPTYEAMGITADELTASAEKYIQVLNQEASDFEDELTRTQNKEVNAKMDLEES